MRNLTPDEQARFFKEGCLFCKNHEFFVGPRGGASANVYCTNCLAGYNVSDPAITVQLIADPGEHTRDYIISICPGTELIERSTLTRLWDWLRGRS